MTRADRLQLADDQALPLPIDVVTQRLAFMGRPGSGKTYAAGKLFELMVVAGVQAIPIDVVGVWYGVRLGRDGKAPGLAVPIFGGLHGDVPLEPGAGALIADLVVDRELTVVLDISQMIDHEQTRFATDFARRFFERKKRHPSPVHLFLEECQELVPQNPQKDETLKLHVFQRLSKLGRNYGIGISLISQRPQDVNKKVFNLTELMLAFQMTAPAERRTIRDWMEEAGLNEDLNALLPKLKVGEARVWSPAWLEIQKTVHIAAKETYDASATPKVGARRVEPKALTPIDLEQISAAMQGAVERARENDPKALRARIAELQKEIKLRPAATLPPPAVERVEIPVFRDGEVSRLEAAVAGLATVGDQLVAAGERVQQAAAEVSTMLRMAQAHVLATPARPVTFTAGTSTTPLRTTPDRAMARRLQAARRPTAAMDGDAVKEHYSGPGGATPDPRSRATLTAPQQRILDALAWLESINVWPADKTQLALLAEQSPTSSGYTNNLGSLRSADLIVYPGPKAAGLTDAGRALANKPDVPPTTAELQRSILARLSRPKAAILQVLIDAYPDALAKDVLAERAGQSPTSSGYTNNLGSLRSLGLIDYPAPGQAAALGVLFLE